jgi:hypothetical protein
MGSVGRLGSDSRSDSRLVPVPASIAALIVATIGSDPLAYAKCVVVALVAGVAAAFIWNVAKLIIPIARMVLSGGHVAQEPVLMIRRPVTIGRPITRRQLRAR